MLQHLTVVWLLCDTNNKCVASNMLAKLIFQDHLDQKLGLFRDHSQFQDLYKPDFLSSFFRTLQDQCEPCLHMSTVLAYQSVAGLVLHVPAENCKVSSLQSFLVPPSSASPRSRHSLPYFCCASADPAVEFCTQSIPALSNGEITSLSTSDGQIANHIS